jgi:hypothetical protein
MQKKVPRAAREKGSFWWKDILRLNTLYCSLLPRDGSTVLFWDDLWSDRVLSHDFPCLFSFAKSARASVKHIMSEKQTWTRFSTFLSPSKPKSAKVLKVLEPQSVSLQRTGVRSSSGQWLCETHVSSSSAVPSTQDTGRPLVVLT